MIKISERDPNLIRDIVDFRQRTYSNHGRTALHRESWSTDDLDLAATHIVMYGEDDQIIGSLRIISGEGPWSIEEYYDFEYDKRNGAEFGRLATSQKSFNGKRVLFELIKAACAHLRQSNRTYFYGFVIEPLRNEIRNLGIPCEELSPAVAPLGQDAYLVRFRVDKVAPILEAL